MDTSTTVRRYELLIFWKFNFIEMEF